MMAFSPSRRPRPGLHRPLADINVTPLVDVMLVLLVVFMVTAPMLAAGLKVNLPHARTATPLPPKATVVVTVDRDGGVSLGAEPVTRDRLVDRVRAELGEEVDRVVRVRGDREASYGTVVEVIDLLAAGGLTRLALVARTGPTSPTTAEPVPGASTLLPDVGGDER